MDDWGGMIRASLRGNDERLMLAAVRDDPHMLAGCVHFANADALRTAIALDRARCVPTLLGCCAPHLGRKHIEEAVVLAVNASQPQTLDALLDALVAMDARFDTTSALLAAARSRNHHALERLFLLHPACVVTRRMLARLVVEACEVADLATISAIHSLACQLDYVLAQDSERIGVETFLIATYARLRPGDASGVAELLSAMHPHVIAALQSSF